MVHRCKELLQWFLSRRHLLDDSMQFEKLLCLKAAVQDALPILQMLLRGDGLDKPCMWDSDTCHAAAEFGSLQMLQWLLEQPLPAAHPPHIPEGCKSNRLLCLSR